MPHKFEHYPLNACLTVSWEHFSEGLRLVNRIAGLGKEPATFSFQSGNLEVRLGDLTFISQAAGSWSGRANLRASVLRKIAQSPPTGTGDLHLEVRRDVMIFWRVSEPAPDCSYICEWEITSEPAT